MRGRRRGALLLSEGLLLLKLESECARLETRRNGPARVMCIIIISIIVITHHRGTSHVHHHHQHHRHHTSSRHESCALRRRRARRERERALALVEQLNSSSGLTAASAPTGSHRVRPARRVLGGCRREGLAVSGEGRGRSAGVGARACSPLLRSCSSSRAARSTQRWRRSAARLVGSKVRSCDTPF